MWLRKSKFQCFYVEITDIQMRSIWWSQGRLIWSNSSLIISHYQRVIKRLNQLVILLPGPLKLWSIVRKLNPLVITKPFSDKSLILDAVAPEKRAAPFLFPRLSTVIYIKILFTFNITIQVLQSTLFKENDRSCGFHMVTTLKITWSSHWTF